MIRLQLLLVVCMLYIIKDTLELSGLVETWNYIKDEQ